MFITNRFWLKYGREEDPVEVTTLEHETFEKALKYAQRYARGIKFVGCTIEDENGNILYEICDYGAREEDFRESEETQKEENTERVIEDNSEEKIINSSFEDVSDKSLIRVGTTKYIEDYG